MLLQLCKKAQQALLLLLLKKLTKAQRLAFFALRENKKSKKNFI